MMDGAEPDVLAYMSFPPQHRTKLHSTNPLERLNGEIKRRTYVVGARCCQVDEVSTNIGYLSARRHCGLPLMTGCRLNSFRSGNTCAAN